MKKGTRIRVRDDESMRAWGWARQLGTVVGQDPRGFSRKVVAVQLDRGPSLLQVKGVHVDHLRPL